jgi:DNA-binding IclR family transcriptional regulator
VAGPTGDYRAGPRALEIGLRSGFQNGLPALARPVLLHLAQRTGEGVHLAVFAFLPLAERKRLLASTKFAAFTPATVTKPDAIGTRLDQIRRTGVVVNVDEFIAGASGIAAPVFDQQGEVVGACTVIGPTARMLAQKDALVQLMKSAGNDISRSLGFTPARDR